MVQANPVRSRARQPDKVRSPTPTRAPSLSQRKRVEKILGRLDKAYPEATTALHYKNAFQLLISVILSAQTTDASVNLVTPQLFKKYPTAQALAAARPQDLYSIIYRTGFFRMKAKNIVGASKKLVELFGGRVPATIEELTQLPGVGRKTANVVLSVINPGDNDGGIAVDTHVFRVSNRLRMAHATTAQKVEQQLMQVVPKKDWAHVSHWLILHGRQICHARWPECARCVVMELCPSAKHFLRLEKKLRSGKTKG